MDHTVVRRYHFLVTPLTSAALPPSALRPGRRLRLFLSDVDATPTSLDPEEKDNWAWARGECDLAAFAVPGGGSSAYMPEAYRALYDQAGRS